MRSALVLLWACSLFVLLGALPANPAGAEGGAPGSERVPPQGPGIGDVVLLKQPGVAAYEEVAEAFSEHCRVRVRPVTLPMTRPSAPSAPMAMMREDWSPQLLESVRQRVAGASLVVAVGQQAVDALSGLPVSLATALAPDPPQSAISADSNGTVVADLSFRALRLARQRVRRIGAVTTRRGLVRLQQARAAAQRLGLELVERLVEDSPHAIRALRDLSQLDPPVDALWIGADPQLLTTPVFQYLLQLQLSYGLPVLASTRQQVRSGALLAVDWRPRAVGRRLAALVNLALDGVHHPEVAGRDDPAGSPEVSLNRLMAHKFGLDVAALQGAGWRTE